MFGSRRQNDMIRKLKYRITNETFYVRTNVLYQAEGGGVSDSILGTSSYVGFLTKSTLALEVPVARYTLR